MSKFAFASTALSLGAAAAHHIFETYSADGGCTNVETAAANFKEVLALAAFGLATATLASLADSARSYRRGHGTHAESDPDTRCICTPRTWYIFGLGIWR